MIRQDKHIYFTLALFYDAAFTAAAWFLCWVVRFKLGLFPHAGDASTEFSRFATVFPIILLCNVAALGFVGLYRPSRTRSLFRERIQVVQGAVLAWLFIMAALYYVSTTFYSRPLLFGFLFANPVALTVSRTLVRLTLRQLRRRGWAVRRAAIIGTGRLAQRALHGLKSDPWLGVRVVYFIKEDEATSRKMVRGVRVLGAVDEIIEILTKHPVDSVFVAVPMDRADVIERALEQLAKLPVSVAVIPDFKGVVTLNTSVDELEGLPVIQLVSNPIQGWYAVAKRAIDLAGAAGLLLLFSVPMLVLSLLVKLTSPGPVLFSQTRMGLGGKRFTILKFRSMRLNAEAETGPVWASREDSRCTSLGRIMRRTSLDELPQLFNVLCGTMSLVGPRPERPGFVEDFVKTVPAYMLRHNVKAGITGWAQINGLRGDTSLKKRLQYDLYYINNWSLSFDLFILLRTPFVGFLNKNAH